MGPAAVPCTAGWSGHGCAGKTSKGAAVLNQHCGSFYLRISGGPRGQTPTDHKVMTYLSDMPAPYEGVVVQGKTVKGLQT